MPNNFEFRVFRCQGLIDLLKFCYERGKIRNKINVPDHALALQTVQETIDPEVNAGEGYGLAPIGHVVTVEKAEAVSVAVTTNNLLKFCYERGKIRNKINVPDHALAPPYTGT